VSKTPASKRRRFTPIAVVAGLVGSAAIALTLGASLSGLIATITNSTNTAATAAMAIQETSGVNTCNSYDTTTTCSTINKYGGTTTPLVPGASQTVTVKFANTGTVNATTATLAPGACVATSTGVIGGTTPTTPNTTAGNLCSVMNIAVYAATTATGTPIYTGSAAGFTATVPLGALAAAANQSYTFVTSLPSTATTAVQGQQISQPLVWTFNQ
jgi:hypothetical protein